MPSLYIVGTPIGNLSDISERAIQTLHESHTIVAEDTRITGKLLSRFGIKTPMVSFNKDNAEKRIPSLIKILKEHDMSLVTDAGTPGISDPGFELIRSLRSHAVVIIPIPGPSAVTTALSTAPFSTDSFYFAGFAPRRKKDILQLVAKTRPLKVPVVLFESPKRITNLLKILSEETPEQEVLIMREMTKMYEERFIGTVKEALDFFQKPRGEFTIVLAPSPADNPRLTDIEISDTIKRLSKEVSGTRELARHLSELSGLSNSEAYRRVLDTPLSEEP